MVQRVSAEHFVGRCAVEEDDVGEFWGEWAGWRECGPRPESRNDGAQADCTKVRYSNERKHGRHDLRCTLQRDNGQMSAAVQPFDVQGQGPQL